MKKDNYDISNGNLKVLETIPLMMKDNKFRRELRKLTLEFLLKNNERTSSKT